MSTKFEEIKIKIDELSIPNNPDAAKLQAVKDELFKTAAEFTLAVTAGNDAKVDELGEKLTALDKQKAILEAVNYAADNGQLREARIKASGIRSMVRKFESETLEELDGLVKKREKLIEKFKTARKTFLENVYKLGEINNIISTRCQQLEEARPYNESPAVGGSAYSSKYRLLHFQNIDPTARAKKAWFAGAHAQGIGTVEAINESEVLTPEFTPFKEVEENA